MAAANREDGVLIDFDIKIRSLETQMERKRQFIHFLQDDLLHNYSRDQKQEMIVQARNEIAQLEHNKDLTIQSKQDYIHQLAAARGGGH
jgi:hypothetical protein